MIDYATWCAIRDGIAQHLTPTQLADSLGLDIKTVRHWIGRPYTRRARVQRSSKLDPFKGRIVGWLDAHPLTAQQVFQRLCEAGYEGGISIVKDYVRTIRPRPRAAFPTLAFAPGEMARVDWGEFGTIAVGNTRRRLSFFVMCWRTAGGCTSSSPCRRRWSTSWPPTSTPSTRWVCRRR